jgi:hypothetical protein
MQTNAFSRTLMSSEGLWVAVSETAYVRDRCAFGRRTALLSGGEAFEPSSDLTARNGFRDFHRHGDLQDFSCSCASLCASARAPAAARATRFGSAGAAGTVGRTSTRRSQATRSSSGAIHDLLGPAQLEDPGGRRVCLLDRRFVITSRLQAAHRRVSRCPGRRVPAAVSRAARPATRCRAVRSRSRRGRVSRGR